MSKPSRSVFAKVLGNVSSRSTLLKTFETRLQKLSEALEPPEPMSKSAQGDLLGTLKKILAQPMEEKSSRAPVQNHFQGLFTGLHTLTELSSPVRNILNSPDSVKIQYMTNNCKTEGDLINFLDELYYHRSLSRNVAAAILKNPGITNVAPFMKIINGGNLLRWSISVRHIFSLQLANKCYDLGDITTARSLILDCFDTTWAPLLVSTELPSSVVFGLGIALQMLHGEHDLIKQANAWNNKTFAQSSHSTGSGLRRVIYPLIKSTIKLSGGKNHGNSSSLRSELNLAGQRCCTDNDVNGLFLSCLAEVDAYSLKTYDISHVVPFKKELNDSLTWLIEHQPGWNIQVMNRLLDICQSSPEELAQKLIPSLDKYVKTNYTEQDVSMALIYHKLELCGARI